MQSELQGERVRGSAAWSFGVCHWLSITCSCATVVDVASDDDASRLQAGHATEPAAQARPGQWQEFVSQVSAVCNMNCNRVVQVIMDFIDQCMPTQEDSLEPDPDGNDMHDTQTATYVANIPDEQRQKRKGQHSQSQPCHCSFCNETLYLTDYATQLLCVHTR